VVPQTTSLWREFKHSAKKATWHYLGKWLRCTEFFARQLGKYFLPEENEYCKIYAANVPPTSRSHQPQMALPRGTLLPCAASSTLGIWRVCRVSFGCRVTFTRLSATVPLHRVLLFAENSSRLRPSLHRARALALGVSGSTRRRRFFQ
jgi:hypothetical protein